MHVVCHDSRQLHCLRKVHALCVLLVLCGCSVAPLQNTAAYSPVRPAISRPTGESNGAIYQEGKDVALFQDIKARRVGDVLTVELVERTDASKKASTNTSRSTAVDIANPTILGRPVTAGGVGILAANLDASHDFAGQGDSSQSNSLTGNITVTVAEVLPNGNMVVRGEKRLTLNRGDEFIQLSGIIRPSDVDTNNTVLSTQLADARITYSGRGELAQANTMGWLARFFNSVFWPF